MFKRTYLPMLICLLTTLSFGSVYAQPKIIVGDGEILNFGDISVPPKFREAKVSVRNVGNDTLYIHRIDRSCRCTDFTLSSEVVPPAGVSTIELKVNFDIDRSSGPRTTELKIYSNDPVDSVVAFVCQANVVRPIVIEPNSFPRILGARAERWTRTRVKVRNDSDEPVRFGVPVVTEKRNQELQTEILINDEKLREGQVLAAGDTVELSLRFMAPVAGRYLGNLIIPMVGSQPFEFEADFATIVDNKDGSQQIELKMESDGGEMPPVGHQ